MHTEHRNDLAGLLNRALRLAPRRVAVACPDWRITYAELGARVARLAALLPQGTPARPEPIAVVAEHDAEVPELYFAVWCAGNAVVPISARLPEEAIARIAAKARVRLGLLAPSAASRQAAIAATANAARWMRHDAAAAPAPLPLRGDALPAGTAMICFTSGTTGEPKGVVLTQQNFLVHVLTSLGVFRVGPENVQINPMPLAHMTGATRVMQTVAALGTHVILPAFRPVPVMQAIAAFRGTHMIVAPTMIGDLLAAEPERFDLSSLQMLVYGTAPMPMRLARELTERVSCALINGYGMTETSALATALSPEAHRRALAEGNAALLGTVGQAVPGIELKIVDAALAEVPPGVEGQIAMRGAKISPGYLDNPAETARRFRPDGWLLSGDMGRLVEDDYVAVLGRMDDMIISGGINVQPGELEAEVMLYPGIAECAVFGVPSERWGREVRLAVVPRAGAKIDAETLRGFLRTRVDPYKLPKQIHVLPQLPRTNVGKIQRFVLVKEFSDQK